MGGEREEEEVLSDMTRKENWDKFYTTRGTDDSFEWYSEWAQIRGTLLPLLLLPPDTPSLPRILVPGCGNSSLSHELYDLGFKLITNIDFSQVVVSDMVGRHATHRPLMQWLTTDMTCMQHVKMKTQAPRLRWNNMIKWCVDRWKGYSSWAISRTRYLNAMMYFIWRARSVVIFDNKKILASWIKS